MLAWQVSGLLVALGADGIAAQAIKAVVVMAVSPVPTATAPASFVVSSPVPTSTSPARFDVSSLQVSIQTQSSACGFHNGKFEYPNYPIPGYECRVDTSNGVFGSCAVTATTMADCGIAVRCFDGSPCSTGCGQTSNVASPRTIYWYVSLSYLCEPAPDLTLVCPSQRTKYGTLMSLGDS